MLKLSKIRQLLALVIVVATLVLGVVVGVRYFLLKGKAAKLEQLPANIDVTLKKIHYTETRQGQKKWDLLADKGEFDKNTEMIRLANVSLVFEPGKPDGEIRLTSEAAEYNAKIGDVKLVGNVKAVTSSGARFSTDRIFYTAESGAISTDEAVKYEDGRLSVEGVGLVYRVKNRDLRIKQKVTASVTPRRAVE